MSRSRSNLPALIGFAEALRELGISPSMGERLLRDASSDWPRPFRVGRKRYYVRQQLMHYIEQKAAQQSR